MIITCEKCSKNFKIQDDLIPSGGRELQCGSCDHKWFYKKFEESIRLEDEVSTIPFTKKNVENSHEINEISNTKNENEYTIKSQKIKSAKKPQKKSRIIKNIMVFLISIIGLIILVDTFKFQLNNYIPGLDLILNNLYESLKDISLFFKDIVN
tara:strand:- start:547 stop:1005 length:459 start_codon:yes stop_codon:yes gene_type:complete